MTNWVYPLGSAAAGPWDISLGTSDSTVAVEGWAHTGLKVATLDAGAVVELPAAAEERIVIPLSGSFTAAVGGRDYELAGRASVFSGPSDVLYTGPDSAVRIGSADGGRVAIATAPAKTSYPARLVTAGEIPVELRGAGNCSRQVHNFGTPAALEADRFIVCEVITPAGNWSSYPPHKHDEEKDGETSLEEIYYFETRVAPGAPDQGAADAVGYQRVYASDERPIDVAAEVRTGDVVAGALRLARAGHGRPGLRPLLPERHGRARTGPRLAHQRRPAPRLDPPDLGGPGRGSAPAVYGRVLGIR